MSAKTAFEAVMYYKELERIIPNSSMIREVRWQYADMARGGTGGFVEIGENKNETCREINYPDHPDSFFQEVCALMGWSW